MDKYSYNINHEMVKSTVGNWCKSEDVEQLQAEIAQLKGRKPASEEIYSAATNALNTEIEIKQECRKILEETLDRDKNPNDSLMDLVVVACNALFYARVQKAHFTMANLKAENDKLKEFARTVIKNCCWDIQDPDGGDIQELAEKLGLIQPTTATEEDINELSDFEVGDEIFKFTDILKENRK